MVTRVPARWIALTALGALATLSLQACREAKVDPEGAREAREAMLYGVASQLREPPASLGVLDFESVTWKDTCLEIARRGPCAAGDVPGYRLRLTRRGEPFEYRATAADPSDVALASAPNPHVGTPVLSWMWNGAPGGCQMLAITTDARPVIGWCDGPLLETEWLEGRFSGAEWSYLYERFTPFLDTGDPALVFQGRGSDSTGVAWRHAIARWAELRWSELDAGRSGAAHGRALAYRRPVRDRPELCDVLEVTEYGVGWLGRAQCEGGGGQPGHAAWLSDALWQKLDGWLEAWGTYSDPARGLELFGRGTRALTPAQVRELEMWVDQAMANVAYSDREAWPVSR